MEQLTTGIDLVEIESIRNMMDKKRFLIRCFSPQEHLLFQQKNIHALQTMAANFAAKEAFSKAMGTGIRGFYLKEISVLRDSLGAPFFELDGSAKKMVETRQLTLSLSLTHTKQYACAVVVAYRSIKIK